MEKRRDREEMDMEYAKPSQLKRGLLKADGRKLQKPQGCPSILSGESLSKNLEQYKKYLDFAIQELQQKVGYPVEFVEAMRLEIFYSSICRYHFTLKMNEGKLEKIYRALVQVPICKQDMELASLEELSPNPTILLQERSQNKQMEFVSRLKTGVNSGQPVWKDEPMERKGITYPGALKLPQHMETFKKYLDFTVKEIQQKVGKSVELVEVMRLNVSYGAIICHYHFTLKIREGNLEKVYWAFVQVPAGTDCMELSYLEERTPKTVILLSGEPSQNKSRNVEAVGEDEEEKTWLMRLIEQLKNVKVRDSIQSTDLSEDF